MDASLNPVMMREPGTGRLCMVAGRDRDRFEQAGYTAIGEGADAPRPAPEAEPAPVASEEAAPGDDIGETPKTGGAARPRRRSK